MKPNKDLAAQISALESFRSTALRIKQLSDAEAALRRRLAYAAEREADLTSKIQRLCNERGRVHETKSSLSADLDLFQRELIRLRALRFDLPAEQLSSIIASIE